MNPVLFGWIETLVVALLGVVRWIQACLAYVDPRRDRWIFADEFGHGLSSAVDRMPLVVLGVAVPSRQQRNLFFGNWVLTMDRAVAPCPRV